MSNRNHNDSQSLWDGYQRAEALYQAQKAEEREALLVREENFQRELLDKKLKQVENLSNSILHLAQSISEASRPTINIYLSQNTSPEEIENIVKKISDAMENKENNS